MLGLVVCFNMLRRRPPDPLFALRGHTSPISCLCEDDSCRFLISGYFISSYFHWLVHKQEMLQFGIYKRDDKLRIEQDFIQMVSFKLDIWKKTKHLRYTVYYRIICRHGKEGKIQIVDISTGLNSIIATHSCGSLTFCKATVADGDEKNSLFVPMEDDTVLSVLMINND